MTGPIGYRIDDDPERIDLDVVWEFLSTRAYWARWRTRLDVAAQVAGAWRVVGAYDAGSGAQVGFARAISDGVSLGYLADVFVLDEHRGHGLGHALVAALTDEGPGASFRWLLHTADAHGLYAAHGFAAPDATLLERPARPQEPSSPRT
jgi:GNAT superfamily N-acetyltransferase